MAIREYAVIHINMCKRVHTYTRAHTHTRTHTHTHTHTHKHTNPYAQSQMPIIPGDKTLVAKWANQHKSLVDKTLIHMKTS